MTPRAGLPDSDPDPSLPGNLDPRVVAGFGDEWSRLPQDALAPEELAAIFEGYFRLFPWEALARDAVGADIGCGSGRWARLVAPRVGMLHLVDASGEALAVARRTLCGAANVRFHHASVGDLPFADASLDFAYSLGVLHHVPDTPGALRAVAAKLRPGAPFLVYLYYAFDNRPRCYRGLWRLAEGLRTPISRLPHPVRYAASQLLAAGLYWPLARTAKLLERLGRLPPSWPLGWYRDKSFYTMRTDALDRFGTRLEKRFTRREIAGMLGEAGFGNIRFSDAPPYWCAVGERDAGLPVRP